MPGDHELPIRISTTISLSIHDVDMRYALDLEQMLSMENRENLKVEVPVDIAREPLTITITGRDLPELRAVMNSSLKWIHCSNKIEEICR